MPLDTFICGSCMVSFNDIEQFILHKNGMCCKTTESSDMLQAQVVQQAPGSVVEGGLSIISSDNSVHQPLVSGDITTAMDITAEQSGIVTTAVGIPGSETLFSNASEIFQTDNQQTVIILQGDLPSSLSLENGQLIATATEITTPQQFQTDVNTGVVPRKKGKVGRPKKIKTDEKAKQKKALPEVKEKNEPEIGADGKLTCRRCKKVFSRERMFNAHKCIVLSEYVDFTTKDVPSIDPDDNDMPQDDLDDAGALDMDCTDVEFKMPQTVKKEPSQDSSTDSPTDTDDEMRELNELKEAEDASQSASNDIDSDNTEATLQAAAVKAEQACMEASEPPDNNQVKIIPVQLQGGPDTDDISKETDKINTVPMHLSEEEKARFEACLNIDLSGLDNMFRTHCIEQEVNQNVSQLSRFSTNELALYSCNTCDKVFKSMAHMRFHVLIHTDLKPFRCFKCSYMSNSRGNLYTHMRKHTGQFYRCEHCKFKTVNKSHLVEHQQTHSSVKQRCNICRKLYNTQKSLMSHIRKYHDNAKGRDYLQSFMQGRDVRGTTIIHQCHVCNRKFKKKTDRDRHLFVHDIKDLSMIQHCELCNYSASRVKYLEKHFQKHRCIYRCCKCKAMFLSSVKLVEHLTTMHTENSDDMTWEQLFEESIAASLYLPEPDGLSSEEKLLVNLPPELSEADMTEVKLLNTGEDYLPLASADLYINKEPAVTVEENEESVSAKESMDICMEDSVTVDGVAMDTSKTSDTDNNLINSTDVINNRSMLVNGSTEGVKVVANAETELDRSLASKSQDSGQAVEGEVMVTEDDAGIKTEMVDGSMHDPMRLPVNTVSAEDGGDVVESDELAENGLTGTGPSTLDGDIVTIPVTDGHIDPDGVQETSVVEETNLTDSDLLGAEKRHILAAQKLIDKLGYRQMSLKIFQKMRDTFGTEECEYCGRLFFSRMDYEPHVRTHTGDKPFVCPKCSFRSITKENLKRHIDKEHENITYPCRDCAYVAYTRTQLWNHAMKHKGLKGLECPSCREQFETMTELKEHADQLHPNANIEELDKLLSNKHKIQGKIGRRSYKCPHCDKVFVRASSELQKHMWIHEGIKPFKCPLCPYACRSKNNLQAHMLRHSKDKPFLCGDCGKAYKSKTALRWHVRSHASGKLFKCDKCPYEATQRSHLKRHMETHDVIKRYVCGECQFSANTLGFLKVHYARFHKDIDTTNLPSFNTMSPIHITQDVNTYKCLSCNYLFGNMSDLKRHLKTRHHVNVKELQKVEDGQGGYQVVHLEESDAQAVQGTLIGQQMSQIGSPGVKMQVMTEVLADNSGVQESHIVTDENLDEKTASAVNILQQIIGLSQNGGGAITQEVDGSSVMTVNPETIIVEQAGSEMYVSGDTTTEIDGNQYVIQYIPQSEVGDDMGIVEIQSDQVITEAEVLV